MKWLSVASRGLGLPFPYTSPRVTITIELSNPKQSYTTWDQIAGTITVMVDDDTTFDNIKITFEGSSRVVLLQPMTLNREIKASHTFLKLEQPMYEVDYSTSRTFAPGRRFYTYPFTFVIPGELPLGSCLHSGGILNGEWAYIPQRHPELPPTMRLENISQELCRISYLIRTTISRKEKVIATSTRDVRFTPTFPNSIQKLPGYGDRTEQKVKGNRKSPVLGQLAVTAAAPQVVQRDTLKCSSAINTEVYMCVQLQFNPIGEVQPPQLRTLYSALRVLTTFHANLDARKLAVRSIASDSRYGGAHVKTTTLPSVNISSTRWLKHMSAHSPQPISSPHPAKWDSGTKEPTSTSSYKDGLYYTASIAFPIVLPRSSDHLPTFNSCLVSRTYFLDLHLSYRNVGTRRRRRTIELQVPVEL